MACPDGTNGLNPADKGDGSNNSSRSSTLGNYEAAIIASFRIIIPVQIERKNYSIAPLETNNMHSSETDSALGSIGISVSISSVQSRSSTVQSSLGQICSSEPVLGLARVSAIHQCRLQQR